MSGTWDAISTNDIARLKLDISTWLKDADNKTTTLVGTPTITCVPNDMTATLITVANSAIYFTPIGMSAGTYTLTFNLVTAAGQTYPKSKTLTVLQGSTPFK
jgi:hypothetical protein